MQHKRIGRVVREYAANRTFLAACAVGAAGVGVAVVVVLARRPGSDAIGLRQAGESTPAEVVRPAETTASPGVATSAETTTSPGVATSAETTTSPGVATSAEAAGTRDAPSDSALADAAGDAAEADASGEARATRSRLHRSKPQLGTASADLTLKPVPLHAVSADATQLYAEGYGPLAAPTVVLVPGWTETISFYEPLIRELLSRGFRIIACDLRGQGKSELGAAHDQSIERYGEDVEAVLAATCPGRRDVIVAGHSMGGMAIVAWAAEFAADQRVRGAALLNTGMAGLAENSSLLAGLPESVRIGVAGSLILHGSTRLVNDAATRAALRYGAFGPDADPEQVRAFTQMATQMPGRARAGAGRTLESLNLVEALQRLTVPTTVLAGDADRLTPVIHSTRMAQALPNLSELLIVPRAGHVAPLEVPVTVADAITRLASAVGVTATSAPAVPVVPSPTTQPIGPPDE